MSQRPILTFDSGLGGLSVFREIRCALPEADHLYVADDQAFPYGAWETNALRDHCVSVISGLIEQYDPALVTIACNTASTLILQDLRASHDILFVGTVPAIRPAANSTKTGMVSVVATPGTAKRDYTQALIDTFAGAVDVMLVGAERLAALAETYVETGRVDQSAVLTEIEPAFHKGCDGRQTDVIVLGCTHYPLLLPVLQEVAPWPVTWLDPAAAIARRVVDLIGEKPVGEGAFTVVATSGADITAKAQHWLNAE